MEVFMRFFKDVRDNHGFNLQIYNSSITDWCITVGYKLTMGKGNEKVIQVQSSDLDFVFAEAQVELKKWLLGNKGGY